MARNQPALRPLTAAQADRIPTVEARGLEVVRATWTSHANPWYFHTRTDDPDAAGRFDLERPMGTCHVAREPIGALLERLCDPEDLDRVISYLLLERLTVWIGPLEIDGPVTDTTHRASRVTTELGSMTPYDVPWQIADVVAELGRVGLQWLLRFDPAGSYGVALFGPASTADDLPDPAVWSPLAQRFAATRWLDDLDGPFHIDDVPSLGQLTIAPSP